MAEIGVLEIAIQDNSKSAADGLNSLARALGKVQTAVGSGINLSGVSSQIKEISTAVSANSKALSSVGTLVNAISGYVNVVSKLKNLDISTKPIENIKNAIGDGIKIGQAGSQINILRQALEGNWNTANADSAATALKTIASGARDLGETNAATVIKSTGTAIEKFSNAMVGLASAKGAESAISSLAASVKDLVALSSEGTDFKEVGLNIARGISEGIASGKEAVYDAAKSLVTGIIDEMKNAGEIHSPSRKTNKEVGQPLVQGIAQGMKESVGYLNSVTSRVVSGAIDTAKEKVKYARSEMEKVKNASHGHMYDIPRASLGGVKGQEASASAVQSSSNVLFGSMNDVRSKLSDFGGMAIGIIDNIRSAFNSLISGNIQFPSLSEFVLGLKSAAYPVVELKNKVVELWETLKTQLPDGALAAKYSMSDLAAGMKKMFPTLSNLMSSFMRIAKTRMIRAAIRQISEGLKEGIENMRGYSDAIKGTFARDMTSLDISLTQMRNSLGAMAAPLIQSLIPAIQAVVRWFTEAVNTVNQFISLLRGQSSWTRALPFDESAEQMEDLEKSTKGASAAMKDLLADWDELNIIQSQSGGGSGSTKTKKDKDKIDYTKMFEEVYTFSEEAQEKVAWLKDNFDDLIRIAKQIGLAVLGWKVSTAFAGLIGTLGTLFATGMTLVIDFSVTSFFDKQFLDTGNAGWLLLSILTPVVTASIAKKILAPLLKDSAYSGALQYVLPVMLTVSVIADIVSLLGATDVSAFSQKSLLLSLKAALTGGAAAAYIAYMKTKSLGTALTGGAVAALGVFGVMMTLKADFSLATDGITKDNILAALSGVASLGITGAIVGAKYLPSLGAVGGAMLFGGAAITTLGVAIGINAVNTAVDAGSITKDAIIKNMLAGAGVGGGLTLIAAATGLLAGWPLAIVGVGGAAITIAALFGIEAILTHQPKKVDWGEDQYEATEQEVKDYVNGCVFETNPNVTIGLINATVEDITNRKAEIESKITDVLGIMYSVRLGLKPGTLEEIKGQVDGLVESFNSGADAYQKALEISVAIGSVKDAEGDEESDGKGIVERSQERWDTLKEKMASLGEELAAAFTTSYEAAEDRNLDEAAKKTIEDISDLMLRIASAISTGQARAKAEIAIDAHIQNLSRESFLDVMKQIKEEKEKLAEELLLARQEGAAGALAQAYAYEELMKYRLKETGGDSTDEEYLKWKSYYEQAMADYEALAKDAVKDVNQVINESMSQEQLAKLRERFISIIKIPLSFDDLYKVVNPASNKEAKKFIHEYMQTMWGSANPADYAQDTEKANEMFRGYMEQAIKKFYGEEDAEAIIMAIEEGYGRYSDIISQEAVENMALSLAFVDRDFFDAHPEMLEMWKNYFLNLFGFGNGNEAKKGQEEAKKRLTEFIKEPIKLDDSGVFNALETDYFTASIYMLGYMQTMWANADPADYAQETEEANKKFKEYLENIIRSQFDKPEDAQTIIDSINAGVLQYSDVINESTVRAMADALELGYADFFNEHEGMHDMWVDYLLNLYGFGNAKETADEIEDEVNKGNEIIRNRVLNMVQDPIDISKANYLLRGRGDSTIQKVHSLMYRMWKGDDLSEYSQEANELQEQFKQYLVSVFQHELGAYDADMIVDSINSGVIDFSDINRATIKGLADMIYYADQTFFDSHNGMREKWTQYLMNMFGLGDDSGIGEMLAGANPLEVNPLNTTAYDLSLKHMKEQTEDTYKDIAGIVNGTGWQKDGVKYNSWTDNDRLKSVIESIMSSQYYGLGTLDLNKRQVVRNDDGTFSTENSVSFYDDYYGKEVLIPTVVDGVMLSVEEAIQHYYDTLYKGNPEYLGKFDTPEQAEAYAQQLHLRQEWLYGMLDELGLLEQFGLTGNGKTATGMPRGWRIASTGPMEMTTGYGGGVSYTEAQAEEDNTNEQLVNGMSRVASTNEDQSGLLRDLIDICTAIANKNFTINITPSSSMGKVVERSGAQLVKVKG